MKPSTPFLSLCLGLFTTAAWAALKPGDAAPDFTVVMSIVPHSSKMKLDAVSKWNASLT